MTFDPKINRMVEGATEYNERVFGLTVSKQKNGAVVVQVAACPDNERLVGKRMSFDVAELDFKEW